MKVCVPIRTQVPTWRYPRMRKSRVTHARRRAFVGTTWRAGGLKELAHISERDDPGKREMGVRGVARRGSVTLLTG